MAEQALDLQPEVPPEDLPKGVTVLRAADPASTSTSSCTYYIVGTAHVSSKSCDDVRAVMQRVRPQVIPDT